MIRSDFSGNPTSPTALVHRLIGQWRAAGSRPETPVDAAAVLRQHPALRGHKSAVLELAFEEYCLRQAGGEVLDAATFSRRFPTFGRSLWRLLVLHEHLDQVLQATGAGRPADWPEVGSTLGGFELLEVLGRGASSCVYLARQNDLGRRTVVLKVSPQRTVEADAVGRLAHPHIVPILFQHEVPDGPWSLVGMPFLGRRTLEDLLDDPQDDLPVNGEAGGVARRRLAAHWIRQLADALVAAHACGILHGDLKPSNVLIDQHGAARLMDFHLAAPIGGVTARVAGTLPYMPPEDLRALLPATELETRRTDARADLFALGVMLCEVATGLLPFGTPTESAAWEELVAGQLQRQRSPWPESLVRAVNDPELLEIIRWCTAYDPDERCPSARQLRDRLDRYLATRSPHPGRSARPKRTTVLAAATAAIVLASVATGARWARPDPSLRRLEDSTAALQAFQSAKQDYAAGRLAEAAHQLTLCTELVAGDARTWAARGHVFRRRAQTDQGREFWELAALDYQRSLRLAESDAIRACLTECHRRLYAPDGARRAGTESLPDEFPSVE